MVEKNGKAEDELMRGVCVSQRMRGTWKMEWTGALKELTVHVKLDVERYAYIHLFKKSQ